MTGTDFIEHETAQAADDRWSLRDSFLFILAFNLSAWTVILWIALAAFGGD